jgi:Putative death-receptor fusion protein (DUF2428)
MLTEKSFGVLSKRDLDNLTRLNFNALTELRHRGAFSAVAQAFSACCARHHQEGRTRALLSLYEVSVKTLWQGLELYSKD